MQLKKNTFLGAFTETPTDAEAVAAALTKEGYVFLPTYFDYLLEHFLDQGKIEKNDDGELVRVVRKSAQAKNVYRVIEDAADMDEPYKLEVKQHVGMLSDDEKEAGWCLTENAAIKKASSMAFHDYKAKTDLIRGLAA